MGAPIDLDQVLKDAMNINFPTLDRNGAEDEEVERRDLLPSIEDIHEEPFDRIHNVVPEDFFIHRPSEDKTVVGVR